MTEAERAGAALAVIFSNPCACPERHASTPEGSCGIQAATTLENAGTVLAVCIPCASCLLAIQFAVPPESRRRR